MTVLFKGPLFRFNVGFPESRGPYDGEKGTEGSSGSGSLLWWILGSRLHLGHGLCCIAGSSKRVSGIQCLF